MFEPPIDRSWSDRERKLFDASIRFGGELWQKGTLFYTVFFPFSCVTWVNSLKCYAHNERLSIRSIGTIDAGVTQW